MSTEATCTDGTDADTNRLITVARLALRLGRCYLSSYGSYKSRHDFTQPQLMACLIVKTYMKRTYRETVELLQVSDGLRGALGLEEKLPHWTTLQKFAQRANVAEVADAMLAEIVQVAAESEQETIFSAAAMDATGLEHSSASAHFVSRSGRQRKHYVKVSVVVMCGALFPASLVVDWGPGNDKAQAKALMEKASHVMQPDVLYADAGYDAEWVHAQAQDDWGVATAIPSVRHTDGTPGGFYRSQMSAHWLKRIGYGLRWHVESFMSGMKRTMGSTLASRTKRGLFVEATLKVLTYALRR